MPGQLLLDTGCRKLALMNSQIANSNWMVLSLAAALGIQRLLFRSETQVRLVIYKDALLTRASDIQSGSQVGLKSEYSYLHKEINL